MTYLVDTNVLLRFVDRTHAAHLMVRGAIRKLHGGGHRTATTFQNCAEFWNVTTRPLANNGFARPPAEANRSLRLVERLFPLLPELPLGYQHWRRLVTVYGVVGVKVHDARLVSAKLSHAITHLLTFNTADFARYAAEGIVAVDPADV